MPDARLHVVAQAPADGVCRARSGRALSMTQPPGGTDACSDPVSNWSPEEIDAHYTMGRCHVMAIALSRETDLSLGIMWSGLDWQVEPDEDGLGGVREVVHVYVDCGDGDVLDVRGKRPLDDMRREFAPHEWDICPCEPLDELTLLDLVEQSDSLVPFDDEDVEEALVVARSQPSTDAALTLLSSKPTSVPGCWVRTAP